MELSAARTPDWLYEVALGRVPGYTIALVQGINFDVDTPGAEDVIPLAGTYTWPTSALACQVVSTSASDTAAGVGARQVTITGLTVAGAELTETVTLNGVTPVATVNSYYRINRFQALGVGTSGGNVGDLSLTSTVGSLPLAMMPAGFGRSQSCVYTVPAGYTGWLLDGFFSMEEFTNTTSFAAFQVLSRSPGMAWINRAYTTLSTGSPTVTLQPRAVGPIPALGDLRVYVRAVGNNNTKVSATMSVLLTAN